MSTLDERWRHPLVQGPDCQTSRVHRIGPAVDIPILASRANRPDEAIFPVSISRGIVEDVPGVYNVILPFAFVAEAIFEEVNAVVELVMSIL